MNQDLTDITVVLDRSGSMAIIADDTRGGFDTFVRDQGVGRGEARLTLVQFDHEYQVVHRARPVKDIPPLNFTPRGNTALLDAIGRAITETGERLAATPESERPGRVAFVIITDGQENASHEYTKGRINAMIKHQRDAYKWDFLFLGANQDAIAEAGALGISHINSVTYGHNPAGVRNVFKSTSTVLLRARSGIGGQSVGAYTAQDRAEAMGEEENPKK